MPTEPPPGAPTPGAQGPPPAAGQPVVLPTVPVPPGWAPVPPGPAVTAGSLGAAPPANPGPFLAALGLLFLVTVPVGVAVFGGITYGVFRWLAGERAGVGDMLGQGFRRIVGLFLTFLLAGLATAGGWLLFVVPGVMIATAASVALPAVMVERLGPMQALKRSFDLTRGHRWSLFAAFLAIFGINLAVSLAGNLLQLAIPIVGVLVSLAFSVVFGTIPYVVPAVAHHDLRLLKEGVDTSQLVKVFE